MLYNHYAKIAGLHCKNHPELRIGQLMSNFEQWLKAEYGIDIFYLENVRFIPLLEEYLKRSNNNAECVEAVSVLWG